MDEERSARENDPQPDPRVGTCIDGRFHIEAILGVGSTSTVYRATSDRGPVALKFLDPGRTDDPNAVARFEQEIRVATTLVHPNIARIFDWGRDDNGHHYAVMEFCPGEPLSSLHGPAPLALTRIVHISRQVLSALEAAHALGVIHRDLKPANLLVGQDDDGGDHVKMLDFGIAKVIDGGLVEAATGGLDRPSTGTGQIVGTPRYLSPEQVQSRPLSGQSDLYAFGVIVYELLTGHPPFTGDSSLAIAIAHAHDPPPPPQRAGQTLTGPLVDLIIACLAKRPAARPRDATEALAQLNACAENPLMVREESPAATGYEDTDPAQPTRLVNPTEDVVWPPRAGARSVQSSPPMESPSEAAAYMALEDGGALKAFLDNVAAPSAPGRPAPPAPIPTHRPHPSAPSIPRKRPRNVWPIAYSILALGAALALLSPLLVDTWNGRAQSGADAPAVEHRVGFYTVLLNSRPEGASVTIEGKPAGETPMEVSWPIHRVTLNLTLNDGKNTRSHTLIADDDGKLVLVQMTGP